MMQSAIYKFWFIAVSWVLNKKHSMHSFNQKMLEVLCRGFLFWDCIAES